MKPFLSLLLCGLWATNSSAQEAANGYTNFVAAGKLILPGENGTPSAPDRNQNPEENLRRQRAAIARNAPALKLLREALKQPFTAPPPAIFTDSAAQNAEMTANSSFRELARQLRQESDVRLTDGDAAGALDSRLTGLELGAAVTHGAPLIGSLVGGAIEAIERQNFEVVAAKLEAPQLRGALVRLRAIDARRASRSETLEADKALATRFIVAQSSGLFQPEGRKMLAFPAVRAQSGFSDAQVKELLALTPKKLAAQIASGFDAIIARDQLPYERALKAPAAPQAALPNLFSIMVAPLIEALQTPQSRVAYERNIVAARLLEGALELRAIKLETGAYPANFEAGIDPFGNKTRFIYHRDGDTYRLYSVGPDGKDDGGEELQAVEINQETGIKGLTSRLTPDSTGDISAPVF